MRMGPISPYLIIHKHSISTQEAKAMNMHSDTFNASVCVCVCVHVCGELFSYTGYDDALIKSRVAIGAYC